MDIQLLEDMVQRRSPYEDSYVRDYYGPNIPRSPMNIDRFVNNMLSDRRRREKR